MISPRRCHTVDEATLQQHKDQYDRQHDDHCRSQHLAPIRRKCPGQVLELHDCRDIALVLQERDCDDEFIPGIEWNAGDSAGSAGWNCRHDPRHGDRDHLNAPPEF
jgi:hypothetical protein